MNSLATNYRIINHNHMTTSYMSGTSASSSSSTNEIEINESNQPDLPPIDKNHKRLFLVRHGEVIPPGGTHGVFYGALDVPLSPLGELEAQAAALYLKQFNLEYVSCSPLKRAIFGAKETLKLQQDIKEFEEGQDLESLLSVYDGFSELDRGDWCGKTKTEIGADLMARFDNCDESVTPKNGESLIYLKSRVMDAQKQLLQKMTPGKASAIVSHLQVTRSMLSDALGMDIKKMTSELTVKTASITCIDYDGETNEAIKVHFQSFKPDAGLETAKDGGNVV